MPVSLGDFGQRPIFRGLLATVLPSAYSVDGTRTSQWIGNPGHRLVCLVLDLESLGSEVEALVQLQRELPDGSDVVLPNALDVGVASMGPLDTPGKHFMAAFVGVFSPQRWRVEVTHQFTGADDIGITYSAVSAFSPGGRGVI